MDVLWSHMDFCGFLMSLHSICDGLLSSFGCLVGGFKWFNKPFWHVLFGDLGYSSHSGLSSMSCFFGCLVLRACSWAGRFARSPNLCKTDTTAGLDLFQRGERGPKSKHSEGT